jgi:hypothetical protein
MRSGDETILWTTSDGLPCVVLPYDETRLRLRLIRTHGTVKADVFPGVAEARAGSKEHRVARFVQSASPSSETISRSPNAGLLRAISGRARRG